MNGYLPSWSRKAHPKNTEIIGRGSFKVCPKEEQKFQFYPLMGVGALLGALRVISKKFPPNPSPMKPPIFIFVVFSS